MLFGLEGHLMVFVGYLIALASLLVLGQRSWRKGQHTPKALELAEAAKVFPESEWEAPIPVVGSSLIESTQVLKRTASGTITAFRLTPETRARLKMNVPKLIEPMDHFLTRYEKYLRAEIDYHELHRLEGWDS